MISWSLIPPHRDCLDLQPYRMVKVVYGSTEVFCDRFIDHRFRTHDQMIQATRIGKQNIAEGSMASGISKKTELKLVGLARASLEELPWISKTSCARRA
jgi:restriction system protein